jgi:hypothetical protein
MFSLVHTQDLNLSPLVQLNKTSGIWIFVESMETILGTFKQFEMVLKYSDISNEDSVIQGSMDE